MHSWPCRDATAPRGTRERIVALEAVRLVEVLLRMTQSVRVVREKQAVASTRCRERIRRTRLHNRLKHMNGSCRHTEALTIVPFLKEGDSDRTQRVPRWFLLLAPFELGSLHRRSGPLRPLGAAQTW